jgi:hypothetical protein
MENYADLMDPEQDAEGGAHEARGPAKGSDTAALVVHEELEVEQAAPALYEPAQQLLPAGLAELISQYIQQSSR